MCDRNGAPASPDPVKRATCPECLGGKFARDGRQPCDWCKGSGCAPTWTLPPAHVKPDRCKKSTAELLAEAERIDGAASPGLVPALAAALRGALKELATDDELLATRKRLLDMFECPEHGSGCVPHAMESVERMRAALIAARDWRGLDGDGITDPVRAMIVVAIDEKEAPMPDLTPPAPMSDARLSEIRSVLTGIHGAPVGQNWYYYVSDLLVECDRLRAALASEREACRAAALSGEPYPEFVAVSTPGAAYVSGRGHAAAAVAARKEKP